MTSKWLKVLVLFAFVVGTISAGAARADDENELRFRGVIEILPATPGFIGDWRVSGRTVHVTGATRIEQEHGQVAVGKNVDVEGTKRADGSVDAEEIEVTEAEGENEIEFTGIVESLPSTPGLIGDWRIGGRIVHVASATSIENEHGPVAVGVMVEVEGIQRADGSIDAIKIEVKENVTELKGVIESLPGTPGFIGDWKVSGKTVHVSPSTKIDQEHGAPAVGAAVEVKGTLKADGSIDASKIEIKSSGEEAQRGNFKGKIQSLPSGPSLVGDWMVAGRLVHVVSSTQLKSKHGAFAVGALVKVKGMLMADGSVVATKIQLKHAN